MSPSFTAEIAEEKARHWWDVFRSVVFLERFAYLISFRSCFLVTHIRLAGLHITPAMNHALLKRT